jgi:adenosylcobinamide kinase / adenosylcobinamide-phosphate guanylyltransferase
MGHIILVTGGARSGKSSHALELARSHANQRLYFLATGEALDAEMVSRIACHRAARGPEFQTVEEPLRLACALALIEEDAGAVIVDCLTLWISNLMGTGASDDAILAEADALAAALRRARFVSVVVTGEVGAGIVPDNPVARRFRDLLGWANQRIAREADEVIMMVAGYPMRVK